MTATTVKSENVTNIVAAPRAYLDGKVGNPVVVIDQIAVATTSMDEVGDVILFGPIPSNAILTGLWHMNDALAASGLAYDIGLYYSGIGNGSQNAYGTAISANCIATSKVITSANVTWQDARFEAADIVSVKKELWDLAGLTADPGGLFFIGFKVAVVATTPAAGDLVVKMEYFI